MAAKGESYAFGTHLKVTQLPRRHQDDIIRDCHQEGHHWDNPRGWDTVVTYDSGRHLRKEQRCVRSGVGCGCRRILRMTPRTLRPMGRPYILYPAGYRYDRRYTRWELRAEEVAGRGE